MSIQKVLEMAAQFIALAEGDTKVSTPSNEYQAQRNRLSKFSEELEKGLRSAINEMSNDLSTLRYRDFDPKMFKLLGNIYQTLIDIIKSLDESKPYIAAEKVVRLVSERQTRIILENLEYLAKAHVSATNVDFTPSPRLKHPEIRSFAVLRKLASELKQFMDKHPLIVPPGQLAPTVPPPALLRQREPEFTAGKEEETNPSSPLAKKK